MKPRRHLTTILVFAIAIFFTACEDNNDSNFNKTNLQGTWVETDSFPIQFVNFYSDNKGKFGTYSKNFQEYSPFTYRMIDSEQIAIKLDEDKNQETFHKLIRRGNDTIEISDLTVIPENPNTIYARKEIITKKKNDTIIIGHNQIFFDFKNDIRLELDKVKDSRCPEGMKCWGGNAVVKFDLILDGNYRHELVLNTHRRLGNDTLINNYNFKLVEILPYPKRNQKIKQEDYIAKIIIENK